MTEPELPGTDSVAKIADWVELCVMLRSIPISKSRILDICQGHDSSVTETEVDGALTELIRRVALYGEATTCTIDGNTVRPASTLKKRPELVMCLMFSLYGVRKKKGQDDGTKLFECISRDAVKAYLGGHAEVIGYPSGGHLSKQLTKLTSSMCEEIGHRTPKPTDKDKGVDVIAWKSHNDKRSNQLIILLQAGAGIHFETKKPIPARAWHDFVHFSAEPIHGIAVPAVVESSEWDNMREYNMIFDRVRISKALLKATAMDGNLRKQIEKWCRRQLN